MLYLSIILLLCVAIICMGLSRTVPTRWLGLVATGATGVAGGALAYDWLRGPVFDFPILRWVVLEDTRIFVSPQLSDMQMGLALILLYGGALVLLALSLTLAPTVRGFGGLFAASLLAIAAVLFGFVSSRLLLPCAWSLAVLLGYGAVWSSGALNRNDQLPQGVALGLLASVLLLGGLLAAEPALSGGEVPSIAALLCIIVACVIMVGGVPFHSTLEEAVSAPAALGAMLHGLVFPLLALTTLHELLLTIPDVPMSWRVMIVILGLLSWLACTSGALGEHSMRRLLGWMASGQAGLVLVAIGLGGPLATVAVPALIGNLAFTTLAGAFAVTTLERLTGSDNFTQTTASINLRLSGVLWGGAALSALGLPPLWGFWGRRWLVEAALIDMPWAVPLIVAASILAALAYLGPLARFGWSGGGKTLLADEVRVQRLSATGPGNILVLLLVLGPLLLLGLMPGLVWEGWLALTNGAPSQLPITATARSLNLIVALLVAAVLLLVLLRRSARRTLPDEDMTPVILAPDALGQSLGFFARIARPTELLRQIWLGVRLLSAGVSLLLSPFENRFYLASVLLAVISMLLLMAQ